jgi:tRNA pseudouridine55 synthase
MCRRDAGMIVRGAIHGVLVVDKPAGMTSHDVVARARRALREKRIGHTGTLDPMATGVLPLVIGRATRLASMLSGAAKTYDAAVRLGCATDTYDATGRVTGHADAPVAADMDIPAPEGITTPMIGAALARFRGSFAQTPPSFSAKKIGGVASYTLARRQQEVTPAPVTVTVSALDLLGYDAGLVRVRVTASAGFYVRSLAHDLGVVLGCGGHLASLRRTRAGAFTDAQAVALDTIEGEGEGAAARVIPMEDLLLEVPAVRLTERGAQRAGHGNAVGPGDFDGQAPALPGRVRLMDPGGRLLGLAESRPGGLLQPVVVLV